MEGELKSERHKRRDLLHSYYGGSKDVETEAVEEAVAADPCDIGTLSIDLIS